MDFLGNRKVYGIMKGTKAILKVTTSVIAVVLFWCIAPEKADAQQVAVKTNALFWAAMTPNLGAEFVIGEHSSIDFSAFGHYKPYGVNSKLVAFQPEYRYWFNGRPMIREYIGASAMIAAYDMTLKQRTYTGNAYSVGITGGYVFALSEHWNFELCAGFSLLFFNQKQYYKHDDYDDHHVENGAVQSNSWGYKLFPAKLGVTFSYIIK